MGYADGVIFEPVNTDDIGAVLGESSHDVKTLCMSSKINLWAKWKPENFTKVTPLTLDDRKNNNFGLSPSKVYADDIVAAIRAETFDPSWYYQRVTAGGTGRMTDFLSPDYTQGYNHGAIHPFPAIYANKTHTIYGATKDTIISVSPPFMGADGSVLDLREFNSNASDLQLRLWYFGIILVNNSRIIVASCENKFEQEFAWSVNFGGLPLTWAGTYTAVPVLSKQSLSKASGGYNTYITSGNRIVGLGNKGVTTTLKTLSNSLSILIYCEALSNGKIRYQAIVDNDTTTSYAFGKFTIWVSNDENGTPGYTLVEKTGNFNAPAEGSWSATGIVSAPAGFKTTAQKRYCQLQCLGVGTSIWTPFAESLKPTEPVDPPIYNDPIVG